MRTSSGFAANSWITSRVSRATSRSAGVNAVAAVSSSPISASTFGRTLTVTVFAASTAGSSINCRSRTGEFLLFASSTISWNLSCATMLSLSTASTPVRLPYGSRNPRPIDCSIRTRACAARSGMIVYRFVTSQPSLSMLTWMTISVGSAALSTANSRATVSSFSASPLLPLESI